MTQQQILADPESSIAVVGATDAPGKYGGIIYRFLKQHGFKVFAVNPNRTVVDGDVTYPNLASLPEQPDIVNVVVPSRIGAAIVDDVTNLGWPSIWFQPGADGAEPVSRATAAGLDVVAGPCIMVEARAHAS